MSIGRQCAFANLGKQFRHRMALAGFNTQGQCIGEEAHQVFQLPACPVGNRDADDDIILTAKAGKDNRPGREQIHKQGRALTLAQCLEGSEYFRTQMERYPAARIALY